jgi:hypothetical protein
MGKTVLLLTCGHTDVQFVDHSKKREFDKGKIGELHDELRDHPDAWELVDSPPERGGILTEFPDSLPWTICTPKFDAVLAYLGETPLHAVLLLETTRNSSGDPRFAGAVLQKRAEGKGIGNVWRSAYLGPADRTLEDRDCPLDAIIRRDVVSRIEVAVRDAVRDATRVVVATTGGMPEIKALVKELARLHAPPGVEPDEIEVDDGARNNGQPDRAVSRKRVDPIEPIRLRKQVLSLIGNGNLLGARGAVQHLDARTHPWTVVIEWLYHFASSLPMPSECDIDVLRHPRMAVRAALRVELALRAGDIPRAVHGTVAFFEAALWDHLLDRFERSSDPKKRRYFKVKSGAAPTGDKLLREKDAKDNPSRPFELKESLDGVDWYWVHDGDGGPAARIAEHFLACPGLSAFVRVLAKKTECDQNFYSLRNDVAHNEPTPALMAEAREKMIAAKLWSNTSMFLSQSLVQNVLQELDAGRHESLLDDLLTKIRQRLICVAG